MASVPREGRKGSQSPPERVMGGSPLHWLGLMGWSQLSGRDWPQQSSATLRPASAQTSSRRSQAALGESAEVGEYRSLEEAWDSNLRGAAHHVLRRTAFPSFPNVAR